MLEKIQKISKFSSFERGQKFSNVLFTCFASDKICLKFKSLKHGSYRTDDRLC